MQLAIYRQREDDEGSRTLLRGIAHETETEKEAYDVFSQVQEMLGRAAGRNRRQKNPQQPDLFGMNSKQKAG